MKETVYGEQRAFDFIVTSDDGKLAGQEPKPQVPIVDVLWNKEGGYVQIVTKCTDPSGGRWAQFMVPDGETTWATDVSDGFYIDLDRRAINALIRNLRRARDAAFGRDE